MTERLVPNTRVVLLTGLPSAGKTTIGRALVDRLGRLGQACQLIDGDEMRERLPPNLGFSRQDRRHQGERARYIAELLVAHDVLVVLAFIAPLRVTREELRQTFGDRYLEVHVRASLQVRESRDTNGVYAKSRSGQVSSYADIDAVYEAPTDPDIGIDTGDQTVEQSVQAILARLTGRG